MAPELDRAKEVGCGLVFTRVKSVLGSAFVSLEMFRGCICFRVGNTKWGPQESLSPCLDASTVSLDDCDLVGFRVMVLSKHIATHIRARADRRLPPLAYTQKVPD